MSSVIQNYSASGTPHLGWYAIQTRARHEKQVEMRLQASEICTFLPMVRQVHRWSDRRKRIEVPLFSCYLFAHITPSAKTRSTVLHTNGVLGFVGAAGEGTPIEDAEIRSIRLLLGSGVDFSSHPFLKKGTRIRIRGGSLDGVEGTLMDGGIDRKIVVSIELIKRSVAITVEGYNIEAA